MGTGALSHQGLAMTPEEFWTILHAVPDQVVTLRRLYHNDSGEPLFYATEDLPGNYIDVDAETFARASSRVRVRNGQLISTVTHQISQKLVPAESGTACDTRDICVVVNTAQPHTNWTILTY